MRDVRDKGSRFAAFLDSRESGAGGGASACAGSVCTSFGRSGLGKAVSGEAVSGDAVSENCRMISENAEFPSSSGPPAGTLAGAPGEELC